MILLPDVLKSIEKKYKISKVWVVDEPYFCVTLDNFNEDVMYELVGYFNLTKNSEKVLSTRLTTGMHFITIDDSGDYQWVWSESYDYMFQLVNSSLNLLKSLKEDNK